MQEEVGGTATLRSQDRCKPCRESVAERISMIVGVFDGSAPTLSLSQITGRTGLPKSTVHRMADQLVEHKWLERAPTGYRLGIRFLEVAGLVTGRAHIRDRALPYLQDLQSATRHCVHLGLLEGRDVVILEKLWGHESARVPTRIGGRIPAHCTAAGRALLALAPPEAVEAVVAGGLDRRTGRTIVVAEVLREELARVRTTQWALESEEYVTGIASVAAPIRGPGPAIAAVSVSGPVQKVDVARVVPLVRRCANEISNELFGRRPRLSPDATAL